MSGPKGDSSDIESRCLAETMRGDSKRVENGENEWKEQNTGG
jgi:hypothetical protein